ncbi:RDD family protein [Aliidiomarina minuta]|uniref:RDD family protein n=1 Tax=Aliidiomarina minuta TaxID=880057 RepID=A0A432W954_9GAMM|nr:RDD family protein [Aliidiomarina minuta]RUO26516.1 RDD family protein [Aliidiomarina minuta]
MEERELEYVGFWSRVGASFIDGVILIALTGPFLAYYYGAGYWEGEKLVYGPLDFLLSYVFPAVAVILFWIYKQATPGKMAISCKVVDDKTGQIPTTAQYITRYLAYYLAAVPMGLGFLWIAFDAKKKGWHDKLAGTVVVRPKRTN